MTSKRKSVCIVIPAYNEASVIRSVVKNVHKAFRETSYDYRVVVVDDGSRDDTAKEASLGGAIVIRHILNSGAGAATRTGLRYARDANFDAVGTMDADGQHDPADLLKVVSHVLKADADFTIGSRLIQRAGMPWYRIVGNMGLSFITYLIFGVNVTDSQSGMKALSKRAVTVMDYYSNNFAFCSEMLWRAKQKKLRVDELPIQAIYSEYSLSKGQKNINGINILKHMLKRRIMEVLDV